MSILKKMVFIIKGKTIIFWISKGTTYGHKFAIKLVNKFLLKEDIKKKLPKVSLNNPPHPVLWCIYYVKKIFLGLYTYMLKFAYLDDKNYDFLSHENTF